MARRGDCCHIAYPSPTRTWAFPCRSPHPPVEPPPSSSGCSISLGRFTTLIQRWIDHTPTLLPQLCLPFATVSCYFLHMGAGQVLFEVRVVFPLVAMVLPSVACRRILPTYVLAYHSHPVDFLLFPRPKDVDERTALPIPPPATSMEAAPSAPVMARAGAVSSVPVWG